jgi:hypothetical protein
VSFRAVSITGKFQLADGSETSFSISSQSDELGIGWQQWGNDTDHLSETVDLIEALTEAAADHLEAEEEEEE